MSMINPFSYGLPIESQEFLNHRRILRQIVNRILSKGQSTAIVGNPNMGKSSLLMYLANPTNSVSLYNKNHHKLFFNMIDSQSLATKLSQAEFWQEALQPIREKLAQTDPNSSLYQHYKVCDDNNFGTFTLQKFFEQLGKNQYKLVLLLDEFDCFLHHPVLNGAEFFGGLRSLASRSKGALAIIIASRRSLTELNNATQQFNPTGSPYFNIFAEFNLKYFPKKDIKELLNWAGDRFSTEDKQYITAIAAGHPYLLQLTASAMWEEKEDTKDPTIYRLAVGKRVYQETKLHYSDTWQVLLPAARKAIAAIALLQISTLLDHHKMNESALLNDLPNFAPEIHELEAIGTLIRDETIPEGYRIAEGAFLWWLADELLRTIRDDISFEEWLQKKEMIGVFTKGQIDNFKSAVKFVAGLLTKGTTTLIETYAKEIPKIEGKS
jgi:hypothetical protein